MTQLGRYVLEAELGRGAMGVVYKARDPRIDRVVALKTLRPDALPEPAAAAEVKQRFLNEAKAAGRLNHPNIVTVHDADEDPATGVAYLAMEFVEGVELKDLLGEGVAPERVADIAADIASALDHAHERGVIHRDVKPANILLDAEGRARLTDFGIARLGASTMTQDGQFLGSPAYMSPEQVRSQEITGASDVFALGVVVFEALTGQRPFVGVDLVSTTHAIANEQPRRPSELASGLDPAVDRVLQRALAKDPAERQATATELARELRAALAGQGPGEATLVGSRRLDAAPSGSASLLSSKRVQLTLLGVLLVSAIAAVALALLGKQGEEPAPSPVAALTPNERPGEPEQTPVREVAPVGAEQPASVEIEPEPPAPLEQPTEGGLSQAEREAEAAVESAMAVLPESAPTEDRVAYGALSIDLYTFQSGTLLVFDGDRELGRHSVASLKRKKKFRIKNPKRHFELQVPVPAGRRTLSFVYRIDDGKTLRKRSVKDIVKGRELRVVLDVGTLGRDLDVRYP